MSATRRSKHANHTTHKPTSQERLLELSDQEIKDCITYHPEGSTEFRQWFKKLCSFILAQNKAQQEAVGGGLKWWIASPAKRKAWTPPALLEVYVGQLDWVQETRMWKKLYEEGLEVQKG